MVKSLLRRAQNLIRAAKNWRVKLFLSGRGQVFMSDDGDIVQLVPVRKKNSAGLNDCLIKIKGSTARKKMLDNQVFLARSNPDGSGTRLSISLGDKDYAVARRNQNVNFKNRISFCLGGEEIDLYEDLYESERMEIGELYTEYQQKVKGNLEPENQ